MLRCRRHCPNRSFFLHMGTLKRRRTKCEISLHSFQLYSIESTILLAAWYSIAIAIVVTTQNISSKVRRHYDY